MDSTARTASDEDYSLRILLADLDYMRNEAAVRGGTVLKNTGDGLLISFKSAVDAVECALSIQRGFADRAENTAFTHKIGVHIGDVIKKDGDIYGSGVNTASRLVAQCPAGGLCISSTLYELVKQKSQIGQLNLKDFQLTNIEPPIKAYRLEGQIPESLQANSTTNQKNKTMKKISILSLILVSAISAVVAVFAVNNPVTGRFANKIFKHRNDDSSLLVGQWKWFTGDSVTFLRNGTCWGAGPHAGNWAKLGEQQFRISWGNDEWIDIVEIDDNRNFLKGSNQTGGIVSASRISVNPPEDIDNQTSYNLTGTWASKGGEKSSYRIYITQVGKKVFWYHESGIENPVFATAAAGEIIGNKIFATYADIPKGGNRCAGSLKFQINSNSELYLQASSGGWNSGGTYIKLP